MDRHVNSIDGKLQSKRDENYIKMQEYLKRLMKEREQFTKKIGTLTTRYDKLMEIVNGKDKELDDLRFQMQRDRIVHEQAAIKQAHNIMPMSKTPSS